MVRPVRTARPLLLPPLYVAYSEDAGEPTEVFHNNLRARYDAGEREVVDAMQRFAGLAQEARDALVQQQPARLGRLVDQNFDLRRSICRLPREHVEMIEVARRVGASANLPDRAARSSACMTGNRCCAIWSANWGGSAVA